MSGITIELIDALLHPSLGRNAEETFKAIALPVRVHGLFEVLSSLSLQDVSRCMLTCVLMRRDVSSLGGYVLKNSENCWSDVTKILGILLPHLLNMMYSTGVDSQVQRLLGHVIAEVCSVLSLLDSQLALNSASIVLDKIADRCAKADKSSLELMSALIQRAPFCIQKPDTLIQILKSAISNITDQSQQHQLNCIRVILDIMCHIGVGLNMIESCPALSNNPKERMIQMIQMQAINENNPDNLKINFNSSAAALGKSCLPSLYQLLHSIAIASHSEESMEKVLQSLSQISSICPVILACDVETFHNSCIILLLLATHAQDDSVRLIALEALTSLISVSDVRKLLSEYPDTRTVCVQGEQNNGISGLVSLCSSIICTGVDDDVEGWAYEEIKIQDDLSDYEHDSTATFAESIMGSFLQNIGGGSLCLQVVLSIVEPLLASQSWLHVRGGLSLLEICLQSSPRAFSSHIPVAVEAALAFSSNPSVRVQFQALQLLSAICTFDVSLDLRKRYGTRILAAISQQLGNSCGKVVCHACMAITSYCTGGNGRNATMHNIDKEDVLPSLADVISKIANGPLSLDLSRNITVFIRSFEVISCLASVVKEDFAGFYGLIMPGLMSCISFGLETNEKNYINGKGSTSHDLVSLRGSAIEAATIVGSSISVDDDIFHQDAQRIMHIIVPLVQCLQNDAPQLIPQDQMFVASARIATILGDTYKYYLPSIIPHLLGVARLKDDASIVDSEDMVSGQHRELDEDTGLESITLNLPGMGVKKLILNTTQMQEKSQAARAIYEHANALGASFGPYVEKSLDAFVPLITFQYSSDVRSTSAQAVSQIFNSACQYAISDKCPSAYKSFLNDTYGKILQKLARQAQMEEDCDIEALVAFSQAMSTATYAAFSSKDSFSKQVVTLQPNDANCIVGDLIKNVQSSLERRVGAISELYSSSLDEDQVTALEETLAMEAEFLTGIIDSIGYTLKSMKSSFLPIFETQVAPFFAPLLNNNTNLDAKARFGAICIFDDCVEYLGEAAATKYSPMLASAVVVGIEDTDSDIREASVYGIIQIARYCPSALQIYLPRLAEVLYSIAEIGFNTEKDEIENLRFVENSTCALATMSLFPTAMFKDLNIPKSDILRVFIGNLPIQMDYDEAKICHEGLCSLIETGAVDLKSNAKELLNIFGMIAFDVSEGEEVASESTCKRMSSALHALHRQVKSSVLESLYAGLTSEAQSGINALFGN